jgi:hypothetical protein
VASASSTGDHLVSVIIIGVTKLVVLWFARMARFTLKLPAPLMARGHGISSTKCDGEFSGMVDARR